MKRLVWIVLFSFVGVFCLFHLVNQSKEVAFPAPTDGDTFIKMDGDENDNQTKKKKWFDMLHQTAPEDDWKLIEVQNSFDQVRIKQEMLKSYDSRSDYEYVAGGLIYGKWTERGSTNQAGSVFATAYDASTDDIFLVSAGGSIFKGNRSGLGWEVINQDLRFSENLMEIIYDSDGNRRLIAAINHAPYFSDDEGRNWIKSNGLTSFGGAHLFHTHKNKKDHIFGLYKKDNQSRFQLVVSKDNASSFNSIFMFATSDSRNLALAKDHVTDDLYVIVQTNTNLSNIYKYSPISETLELITTASPHAFGADGRGNLNVVNKNGSILLYSYDGELRYHVSEDLGKTWTYLSTLPNAPWTVGMFVSPSNPNVMIYGEVDAYRSQDAGKTWRRINAWHEYYGDVLRKLHADMMAFKEHVDEDGVPFILISNHGGLSITYDGGINNENIGLYDLNVSQYYDVRTYPLDHNFIFAGSQDQGFQKGFLPGDNPEPFTQVISGDYGHICFSENGRRLWTVYPGGWVIYYPTPLSAGHSTSYEIKSDQESVWIPPMIEGPNASENVIYMAGGNINGGNGSHMVRLEHKNNQITASQFPFNFATSGGVLTAMAFSPFNDKKVFGATSNGRFYTSENGGQNFALNGSNLPGSNYLYGSCILPSSIDSNIVYMSGTGYSTAGVRISRNGGKSFSALGTDMPKTMFFNIAANEDESLIFAATEAGPYVYVKATDKWYLLSGINTPNQTFWSVEYLPEKKLARFGTYGRGVWDFEVSDIINSTKQETQETVINVFPNPANDYITIVFDGNFNSNQRFAVVDIQNVSQNCPIIGNSDNRVTFDVSQLRSGVYFIKDLGRKTFSSKKFIKI